MGEKALSELDAKVQQQVELCRKRFNQGDLDFVENVSARLTDQYPDCLEIRRLLRVVQGKKAAKRKAGIQRLFGGLALNLGGAGKIRKDPIRAMAEAEVGIARDVGNAVAHRFLGKAAAAAGFLNTAVFALEHARRLDPKNFAIAIELGRAYIEAGQAENAVKVGETLVVADPANAEAQDLVKDASVAATLNRGRWEEQGDYREKLADESQAIALEQDARKGADQSTLSARRQRLEELLRESSNDLNLYRELADICRKQTDYDAALELIRRARVLPNGASDQALEELEGSIEIESLAFQIASYEKQLSDNSSDALVERQLVECREQLAMVEVRRLVRLVERYPNNAAYRLDYGTLLLSRNEGEAAARHFQMAVRDPRIRHRAIHGLGCAFKLAGKFDLAIDQLETARNELTEMDALKMEVLYELGDAYEKQQRYAEAKDAFKSVYAVDLGFKDISKRLDAVYDR